jgi:hypothetical protein
MCLTSLIGDPGRLRQILMNLVGNGIKFTDEGHIRIEVKRLESAPDGPVNIEMSVTDTGIGMTPEEQQAAALPGLHAGGQLQHASLWRHRTRPRHLQAPWLSSWAASHRRGKPASRRITLLVASAHARPCSPKEMPLNEAHSTTSDEPASSATQ